MRFSLCLTFLAFAWVSTLSGQTRDQVLFTIDGQPVMASEFSYIYGKNNRDDADYSEASLREYLDLYTKFKLKVREAYAMGLDTVTQLQNELNGYRKQLAETYLTDKEITDRLVEEAYQRMQEDILVAHILVKSNPNVPNDTMAAFGKIQNIYQRLQKGENWDDVVRLTSEDNNSKEMGGELGYITALLPNGFYAFETAAYSTPVGAYSKPTRSSIGYHVIKVLARRPARGELDAAHILIRVNSDASNEKDVKSRIDAIYAELKEGGQFEVIARRQSEDKTTAERGGVIGTIAINQFEKPFEEAAFALENDGDFSAPVRTRLGWHIIKRIRKRPMASFEASKRKIETQVNRDERISAARQSMVSRIKKEAGFQVNEQVYNEFVSQAGDELQTYRWQVPDVKPAAIMTLGGDTYTNIDFGNYVRNNARTRMGAPKGTPNQEILDLVFTDFVNEKALFYEEKNLSIKYPEFKSLMREYEEGILLFEATKINVWDKASRDSVGLQKYYMANRNNYMWPERMEVAAVILDSAHKDKMPTLRKWAAKKPLDVVTAKAEKKGIPVQITRKMYSKEDKLPEGLTWSKGQIADLADGMGFMLVEKIIPSTPKTLEETRGYIIADYQDQLEKEWVASLRNKYPVDINEPVLMGLVKK